MVFRIVFTLLLPCMPISGLLSLHAALGGSVKHDEKSEDNGDSSVRIAPRPIKPATVRVGELFPDLKAKSIDGRGFGMSSCVDYTATVIALTSTSCPICKKYLPTLAKIEKEYAGRKVQFCFLNTISVDTDSDIRNAIRKNQIKSPYIHDKSDRFNREFGIRTTAEVFVFDSSRTLVYRGAVDDQYGLGYSLAAPRKNYLRNAIDAMLGNQPIPVTATTAPGCTIWKNGKVQSTQNTYHNRISRIVQQNCVECHREQGLAPFSLESAEEIIAHAGMINTVLENKTMPPWFAKKEKKSRWANDRSLTEKDNRDLLNWLASDRPIGDSADAPVKRKFESEWNIGTPDREFQIPFAHRVKATGTMPYKHAIVQTRFDTDKWLSAVEIRPTDRTVVHHVLVFVRTRSGQNGIDESSGFLAAYVPGNSYQKYPPGFAKKIPAGATLVFQLHYTPNGIATSDRTKIGLKYYQGKPDYQILNKGIANRRIRIEANSSNHREIATQPIGQDVRLLSFMPHMHLRGKAFRYDVVNDGKRETILDVPRYDFNWQLEYRLREPLLVKKGAKIEVTGWYDNSDGNPANPDPDLDVGWGPQTTDEMMLGYVEYYHPDRKVSDAEYAKSVANTDPKPSKPDSKPVKKLGSKITLTLAFRKYDKDSDGKVTRKELGRPILFNRLNSNGDDHLTLKEVLAHAN